MSGPIRVGGTLDPANHLYIERRADSVLFEELRRGQYVSILTSRQQGKSSAMRRAAQRLQEHGIEVVDIDIAGDIGSQVTMDQWYSGILEKICCDLDIEIDVDAWWAERARRSPAQRLQEFFRDELIPQLSAPLVVFCDEIDASLNLPFTDDWFTALRAMYNRRSSEPAFSKVTFCLLGVAHPSELIRKERVTEYNIGVDLELRDFDLREDAQELQKLVTLLGDGGGNGAGILAEIFDWVDGHPFLTMYLAQQCIKHKCSTREQARALIEKLYEDVSGVRKDVHFQTAARLLESRVGLGGARMYRRILRGKVVKDRPRGVQPMLKLTGLVKRADGGALVIRNQVYRRMFDEAWVDDLERMRSDRRWRKAGWAAVVVLLLLVVVCLHYIFVAQPAEQKREEVAKAVRLAKGWQAMLRWTWSKQDAARYRALLKSQDSDPALGKKLQEFERLAEDEFAEQARFLRKARETADELFKANRRPMAMERARGYERAGDIDAQLVLAAFLAARLDRTASERAMRLLARCLQRMSEMANYLEARLQQPVSESVAQLTVQFGQWTADLGSKLSTRSEQRVSDALLRSFEKRGYERLALTLVLPAIQGELGEKDNAVSAVSFSPSNSTLWTGSKDGFVRAWELATGQLLAQGWFDGGEIKSIEVTKHENGRLRVLVLSGESVPYIGSVDETVTRVVQRNLSLTKLPMDAQIGEFRHATVDPQGKWILMSGLNTCIFQLDEPESRPYRCADTPSFHASYSADASQIAIATETGVLVMDRMLGRVVARLKTPVRAVRAWFSDDGQRIAIASQDGTARVWRWRSNEPFTMLKHLPLTKIPARHGFVTSASLCEDTLQNGHVATSAWVEDENGGQAGITAFWSPDGVLQHAFIVGTPVYDASLSAGCQLLASGRADGIVQVWRVSAQRTSTVDDPEERWRDWQKKLGRTVDERTLQVIPLGQRGRIRATRRESR